MKKFLIFLAMLLTFVSFYIFVMARWFSSKTSQLEDPISKQNTEAESPASFLPKSPRESSLSPADQAILEIGSEDYFNFINFPEQKSVKFNFSSCAYVVSSGHMLHSNLGNEIDSYECVIRSNNAPTYGFEKDVGTKTTIRTVAELSFKIIMGELTKNPKAIDRMILNKTIILGWNRWNELLPHYSKAQEKWPNMNMNLVHTETAKKIVNMFELNMGLRLSEQRIWISQGFSAIVHLHGICKRIDVYGMTDPEYCQRARGGKIKDEKFKYHYYRSNDNECKYFEKFDKPFKFTHYFTKEKRIYQKMARLLGKLHFHNPAWPDQEVS